MVVGLAIAIVVEAIANVFHGHRRNTNNRTTHAGRHPVRAFAKLARRAHQTTARIAIVNRTVAIIVDIIADFRSRHHARLAHEHPGDAFGFARTTKPGRSRHTIHPAFGIVIVDDSIAIVINVVTLFWRRILRDAYRRHPARIAVLDRHLTRAHSAGRFAKPVIDGPITIVIDPIAQFESGQYITDARSPLIRFRTRLHAVFARADFSRFRRSRITRVDRTLHARTSLVNLPIAIVIDVVVIAVA
jgi:hypothetical protein